MSDFPFTLCGKCFLSAIFLLLVYSISLLRHLIFIQDGADRDSIPFPTVLPLHLPHFSLFPPFLTPTDVILTPGRWPSS